MSYLGEYEATRVREVATGAQQNSETQRWNEPTQENNKVNVDASVRKGKVGLGRVVTSKIEMEKEMY